MTGSIIDTHQHAFWGGRDDAGLVADMDAHGIAAAWLLTWEMAPSEDAGIYHGALDPRFIRPDGTHMGIPLAAIVEARNRFPDRFVLGYCPHPAYPDAPAFFRSAYDIHGVRVCGEWKFRMPFDDPRCLELFRAAGELKCPVVLHLDAPYLAGPEGKPVYQRDWYGGTIDNLDRALEACPETTFIGHAPGFWRYLSDDAEKRPEAYPTGPITGEGKLLGLFERRPNLWADLSANSALLAMNRDPTFTRNFLIRFADRIVFGRDTYGDALLLTLRTLDLPQDIAAKIYRENALRLVPSSASPAQATTSL